MRVEWSSGDNVIRHDAMRYKHWERHHRKRAFTQQLVGRKDATVLCAAALIAVGT